MVHAVVDCTYELPMAFTVTRGSSAELPKAEQILSELARNPPGLLENCKYFTANWGYNSARLIETLWEEDEGSDGPHRLRSGAGNISYDYRGTVFCHYSGGNRRGMVHGAFESSRASAKFRGPALHYGMGRPDCSKCPVGSAVRIPLSDDPRVFTPLSRASYAWKDIYKKRGACEHVFSRLAGFFGGDIRLCR